VNIDCATQYYYDYNYLLYGLSLRFTQRSYRNEYQKYLLGGGKDGWCVGLTTLPPSCADCHEMCEPLPPGTLRACPGL
jgi:hypothetical protein